MPDDAADEALDLRHPYGRVTPGWCEHCGEYVCRCFSARPLDDPPMLTPPILAPEQSAELDLRTRRICY